MTAPNHVVGGIAITGISLSFWDINIFSNELFLGLCVFASLLPDIDHTKMLGFGWQGRWRWYVGVGRVGALE